MFSQNPYIDATDDGCKSVIAVDRFSVARFRLTDFLSLNHTRLIGLLRLAQLYC